MTFATATGTFGYCPVSMREPRFDQYVVTGLLGRGASGEVFAARDVVLARDVAIKVLREDRKGEEERFEAEARVLAGLEHPGVVPVFGFGRTTDGRPYLVMRRIAGETLEAMVARGSLAPSRAVDLFVRACEAVAHAHRAGIVHRDLKPSNIMVGRDGEVLVLDWGAARGGQARPHATGETLSGTIVGTPGYLAPEAAEGDIAALGPATDVFSLGAILYRLLSGRDALEGPDLVAASIACQIRPVAVAAPGVQEGLAEVCDRCLRLVPIDRHADAGALVEAIRTWRDGDERRARAEALVATGRGTLASWTAAGADARVLRSRVDAEARSLPRGLPLDDPRKTALEGDRLRLGDRERDLAIDFAHVEATAFHAASIDPTPKARALLADALYARVLDAEEVGDPAALEYWCARLRAHDDGSRRALLEEPARLSLTTTPGGARVVGHRWDTRPLVWTLGVPQDLGRTPLHEVALSPGNWLLRIVATDLPEVRLPVKARRGERLLLGADGPIPIPTAQVLGDEWIYVPKGPWIRGGDPDVSYPRPAEAVWTPAFLIQRHATTSGDYAAFLAHLAATGEEWAPRAPRVPTGASRGAGLLWPGQPPFSFPLIDVHGDAWDSKWPICAISHADAEAYAAWRGARLVGDDEFEKAARGVDGRRFPWGDRFDAAVTKCAETRRGRPVPEPIGAIPWDVSPYGVHDLAGSMRTWCATPFDADATLWCIRGGSWGVSERLCRSANRYGLEPQAVQAYLGIRLAMDISVVEER